MTAKALRVLPIVLALTPAPAYAAEAGPLDVNLGLMIWTVVLFVVVLVLLGRYAWPHILGAVEAREARIRDLMGEAERDREAAAELLAERQAELDKSRAHAQELLADSRSAAETMRDQLLAEARAEQEAMLARARRDIGQEREQAISTVRREAVEVAMAAAEKVIGRNLTGEDNRRMVLGYIDQLEGAGHVASGV